MEVNHNARLFKLLMRILETNAPINQTSVSIGFQNQNQNQNQNQKKKENENENEKEIKKITE